MKALYTSTFIVAVVSLLFGCSALTPIRTYTSASEKGIASFESLAYNFERNCLATCRDHDLEAYRLTSTDCDCMDSKYADSINMLMYRAIKGYVQALNQLAGKDVTTLSIPALSESIQASPGVNLKISQKEIDAYTTIGDLLSNAATGQYRKNKLKNFVSHAQTPLTTLIDYLQLNLSGNLNGLIEVRIQRNKSMFYEHIRDKRYSPYERREITATYYEVYDHLERQKQVNLYFTQVLEQIKAGHKDLYNNVENWNNELLVTTMAENAAAINALLIKIEKFK